MDAAQAWRELFLKWPAGAARKGVLVTDFGEQILFSGFMASESMILVERQTPDTVGARKVIVAYPNVTGVKVTEVVKGSVFEALGFKGTIATP
jgi:hypothetical protein